MKLTSLAMLLILWSNAIQASGEQTTVPVITEHETFGGYSIESSMYADGSLEVTIFDAGQNVVFSSRYPVKRSDGDHAEWTYHKNDPPIARSNRIPTTVMPTLSGMTFAAKDIVRMVEMGLAPGSQSREPRKRRLQTEDTWGCDLPGFVDIECTSRGNCCDTHDECYWANQCSYWSWLGVSNIFCENCNTFAVLCITTGFGSTQAPSICCAYGNCGAGRCPGAYWDDPLCWVGASSDPDGPYNDGTGSGSGSGGGGTGSGTSDGSVTYPSAKCCFPDGRCISCW